VVPSSKVLPRLGPRKIIGNGYLKSTTLVSQYVLDTVAIKRPQPVLELGLLFEA